MRPRIPQRIPPLTWRKPVFVWTPLALLLALGWPALLFEGADAQRLALAFACIAASFACVSLALRWRVRGAAKARLVVIGHAVGAAALTAFLAPFFVRAPGQDDAVVAALATIPLLLVIALPLSLISAAAFAWIALRRAPHAEPGELLEISANVQR